MNFEDILKLVEDTSKTKFQLAADIHALISKATQPSALNIKAKVERAKRGPNKAKEAKPLIANGMYKIGDTVQIGGADDHEAH